MVDRGKERRKHERYKTAVEIYFDFIYNLETKVNFELLDQKERKAVSGKYSAVSRNVSVGGLCFASDEKVNQGDLLHLEVYLPGAKDPIHMKGRVQWCKPIASSLDGEASQKTEKGYAFEVGVQLFSVNEVSVDDSIHHDKAYDVDWSVVLESIFGNYKMLMKGKCHPQKE